MPLTPIPADGYKYERDLLRRAFTAGHRFSCRADGNPPTVGGTHVWDESVREAMQFFEEDHNKDKAEKILNGWAAEKGDFVEYALSVATAYLKLRAATRSR